MDQKQIIQQEFRSRQEKLTYYLIALCVTAIGFSVHKTMGEGLDLIQIPLGLSILSWSISVYCGINFVKRNLNGLGMALSPLTTRKEDWEENVDSAAFYIQSQHYLFYSGVFLFIVWHVLEMYDHTLRASEISTHSPSVIF